MATCRGTLSWRVVPSSPRTGQFRETSESSRSVNAVTVSMRIYRSNQRETLAEGYDRLLAPWLALLRKDDQQFHLGVRQFPGHIRREVPRPLHRLPGRTGLRQR